MTKTICSRQRGVGLIESLIAIVILSFGLLGLARFQLGMIAQTTEAGSKLTANAASEDLLTQLRVDLANASCYQVPAAGTACSSPFAKSQAQAWASQLEKNLPGFTSATAILNGNQFTVNVSWKYKTAIDARTHSVTTDVRE